jgi:hypothetical protein
VSYRLVKSKRLPIEPGESWKPGAAEPDTGVKTTPKTGRLPQSQVGPGIMQDYPLAEDQRRRQRSMDQMGGEGPFLENLGPQTAREQLAQLMGGPGSTGGELVDAASWLPPIWAMDMADRANFARMRGDTSLGTGLGGIGAEAAAGYLGGKLLGPAFRMLKNNPEAAAIGAFRAGDAYSRRNEE